MRRRDVPVMVSAGLLLWSLLQPASAGAQAKQGVLDKDTFMDMETVSSPAISPDGSQIVFARGWVDKLKDQGRSNIWIVDTAGTRLRELTRGSWRDSAPVWSPDGSRIAFLSDRDGTTQIHVLFVATGELSQLTHIERTPSNLSWSPDGKQLAFTMFVPDEDSILPVQLPKRPRGAEWARGATIVDRLTWARDGEGPVEKGYTHVFTLDAITGGTPRTITDGRFSHSSPRWSADSQTMYVSGIRKPDAEYLDNDSEIYAIDLASLSVTALTDRKGPDANPTVSPDGRWVAYTGFDEKRFTSHVSSLYLMDKAGGGKRVWAGALNDSPSSVTWAADNSGVYFAVRELGSTSIYFVPVAGGAPRKLTGGSQVLNGLSVASNGQAVTVRSTPLEPGHVAAFDIAHPSAMKKLVDVNADVLDGRALGQVEEVWFESRDGLKVQGWLVKPVGFQPGKKYPMVLWIHGGPWSMYDVGFSWAYQNFAALGYAVLYTNPRGSTGYGQDFVNGIQFSYPGKDYDDLMAGVDAAVAKGFIDEKNLFVCGGSGGGVLTAWIVGHTDRFAAAVSMRPVINWHSFVGTTDGPSWYRQFQKYP
ncbi:MAG TPA: S9 family peptidase, partial [Vicinamibacterales bacterium]|nr:S9 family peptidase [Vicinamibacterales bacterium]